MKGREISLLLLLAIALPGCAKKDELASAKVERRDIAGYELLDGKIVTPPSARADVFSPYRAPVDKVHKSAGDPVNRGEVLIQLAIQGMASWGDQAREYVQAAQTAYASAKTKYGAVYSQAKAAYEQARLAEQSARANMDPDVQRYTDARIAAEQMLASAKADLDINLLPFKQQLDDANEYLRDAQAGARQGQIRAPITGSVISINAAPGTEVGTDRSKPVATIVNLAQLQVHGGMTAEQATRLKPGTSVTLVFTEIEGKEFDGKIARITTLPREDKADDLAYTAIIEFDNEKAVVKPEMTVRMAGLKTGEKKDVLAVPNSALDKDSSGKPIVRVLEGEKWIPRVVEIGITGLEYTEIKSGLDVGETVQVRIER